MCGGEGGGTEISESSVLHVFLTWYTWKWNSIMYILKWHSLCYPIATSPIFVVGSTMRSRELLHTTMFKGWILLGEVMPCHNCRDHESYE